jgi:glutamyl-tRNA synthetase
MILGSDGARLSKRHGAVSVMSYRDQGFLPEALLNYLVRLGWSYGDQEVFSLNEIVKLFELKNINKAPASFDSEKLLWLNQLYLKKAKVKYLIEQLHWHLQILKIEPQATPSLEAVVSHLQTRSKTLVEMAQGMKMFYHDFDTFETTLAQKHFQDKSMLKALSKSLKALKIWQAQEIKNCIQSVCESLGLGFGKVGQPFRLALSGDGNAGNIDTVAELVGKKNTLIRLERAISF